MLTDRALLQSFCQCQLSFSKTGWASRRLFWPDWHFHAWPKACYRFWAGLWTGSSRDDSSRLYRRRQSLQCQGLWARPPCLSRCSVGLPACSGLPETGLKRYELASKLQSAQRSCWLEVFLWSMTGPGSREVRAVQRMGPLWRGWGWLRVQRRPLLAEMVSIGGITRSAACISRTGGLWSRPAWSPDRASLGPVQTSAGSAQWTE